MTSWIDRLRYSTSFRFGYVEHVSARILFLVIVSTFISFRLKYYVWTDRLLIACMILWLVYFISHTLEKMIRPHPHEERK